MQQSSHTARASGGLPWVGLALALVGCEAAPSPRFAFPRLALEPLKTPVPEARTIVGMMNNYPPLERDDQTPAPRSSPAFFVRSPNALASHGDVLPLHEEYSEVRYEAELVVVVGKTASGVTEAEARECIGGYTCGMDGSPVVSATGGERDVARSIAGKSADGVAPVGPYVLAEIDAAAQRIELRVNGRVMESVSSADLIWGPARCIAEVSKTVTLRPGDLVFTGARRAVPRFEAGDHVEVEITDIGVLSNRVAGTRAQPGK